MVVPTNVRLPIRRRASQRAFDLSPILAYPLPMGINEVPSEKRTRLADTNRAMIQVNVFVSYWPLLAYDVHRLAFPAH
jgi:hypothetical protein